VIRISSPGHVAYAVTMISLGVMGLIWGAFAPIWTPVPGISTHHPLAYLCAIIALAGGIGLLIARVAAIASRVLLVWLLAWLVLLRLPHIAVAPGVDTFWAAAQVAVMTAGAWILYLRLAGDQDATRLPFATGDKGLRIARVLFGLAMIPFGVAHFLYLDATTVLIPEWMPAHSALAYFTGAAFIVAGIAVIFGVWARLAATLVTLEVALFTVIVWLPVVITGPNAFQWNEFVVSYAITAGGWLVAESYRGVPWLAAREPRAIGSPSPAAAA
jgi:uncharacterized membrane protein